VNAEALDFRGVYLITTEFHSDERGDFRRVVDFDLLRSFGVEARVERIDELFGAAQGTRTIRAGDEIAVAVGQRG